MVELTNQTSNSIFRKKSYTEDFHHSAVRSASLQAIEDTLDDPVLLIKKASDTQWLSHDHAISTISRVLPYS